MANFDSTVIDAVTGHMNGDHSDDNLLIAKAFGYPEAVSSLMTGLDGVAGVWQVRDAAGEHELRVEWLGGPISERPEIRREAAALYHAACERLGVTPRGQEEHDAAEQAESAGQAGEHGSPHGSPHGHGEHGSTTQHGNGGGRPPHAKPEDDGSFSFAIRTATWGDHDDSEGSSVMEDIMRMRASIELYTELVAQHFFMYDALEEAAKQLAADPRFASLHPATILREQQLEEDLAMLLGADWRDQVKALPATVAYADRIREVAAESWLPGIIAHHYTRYLGDLSGGQMISKRVKKQHGFDRAGIAFYDFSELGDLDSFKQGYRAALDELGATLDDAERQRMIDEVRAAYRFNTMVFVDMQKARDASAV